MPLGPGIELFSGRSRSTSELLLTVTVARGVFALFGHVTNSSRSVRDSASDIERRESHKWSSERPFGRNSVLARQNPASASTGSTENFCTRSHTPFFRVKTFLPRR